MSFKLLGCFCLFLINSIGCEISNAQEDSSFIRIENIEFNFPPIIPDSLKNYVVEKIPRGKEFLSSDSISTVSFYFSGQQKKDSISIYLNNNLRFEDAVSYNPVLSHSTFLFDTDRTKKGKNSIQKLKVLFHKSKRFIETEINLDNPIICISTSFNSKNIKLEEGYGADNIFEGEIIDLPDQVQIYYKKVKPLTSGLY